jgi:hypothetical protein
MASRPSSKTSYISHAHTINHHNDKSTERKGQLTKTEIRLTQSSMMHHNSHTSHNNDRDSYNSCGDLDCDDLDIDDDETSLGAKLHAINTRDDRTFSKNK